MRHYYRHRAVNRYKGVLPSHNCTRSNKASTTAVAHAARAKSSGGGGGTIVRGSDAAISKSALTYFTLKVGWLAGCLLPRRLNFVLKEQRGGRQAGNRAGTCDAGKDRMFFPHFSSKEAKPACPCCCWRRRRRCSCPCRFPRSSLLPVACLPAL
jgi:hypothetical protein